MNKKQLIVTWWIGVLLLSGCATTPPTLEKPIEKSKLFTATYNQVWDALIKSLVSFTKSISPYMIGGFALAPKGYTWSEAEAFVNMSVIRLSEEQIRVNIETKFSAIGVNNSYAVTLALFTGFKGKPSSEKWTLHSKGLLENEYFSKIKALLPKNDNSIYNWKVCAKAIVLKSESKAKEIINRLLKGENFEVLAKKYSIEKDTFINCASIEDVKKWNDSEALDFFFKPELKEGILDDKIHKREDGNYYISKFYKVID